MRSRSGRQVLLAFEAAERETDDAAQRRLLTFVIVGGGPTGVELAGALAEIARQSLRQDFRHIRPESCPHRADRGQPARPRRLPRPLRDAARASLQRLGVEVRTGSIVTTVDAEGVKIGDERIAAQTVLWAAGVAASPVATSLGVPLDRAGRVPAEPTLAVPGHPEIFVVGDICALQQDGAWLPGVAQVAKQGGAHAARNVLRAIRGEPLAAVPVSRLRQHGDDRPRFAVADIGRLNCRGLSPGSSGCFIHIFWLIGFRSRIAVMGEWAWSYVTMQRRVRLITGGQPLARVARRERAAVSHAHLPFSMVVSLLCPVQRPLLMRSHAGMSPVRRNLSCEWVTPAWSSRLHSRSPRAPAATTGLLLIRRIAPSRHSPTPTSRT